MRKLRWISIVLLVAGAAALGVKLRADWSSYRAVNDPSAIKTRPLTPEQAPVPAAAPDYTVVAQQNPFHPERNDAMPPPPPVAPKVTGPPPLVYGSMLLGTEKFALMANESDMKAHKVLQGEEFNGYKLAEVKPQSVVLEYDGTKNEVMFYNALSRLRRQNVVKTQSTAAVSQSTSSAAETPMAPTGLAAAAEVPPPLPPPVAGTPAPPGKKLVMTPFGPIWQDVKQ